jgi:hypothetical protein
MLALPIEAGRWRMRIRDGAGSLRSGPATGIALEVGDDVPVELQLYLKQAIALPPVLEVDGDCDVEQWRHVLQMEVKQVPPDSQAPMVMLNVLQYQFTPSIGDWKRWRLPATLAAILCIVTLAGLNLHAWALRSQEGAVRDRMAEIVSETIPGVSVVLDPVAQMQRRVTELRTGAGIDSGGFLSMASALAPIAGFGSVRSMQYRDNVLTVEFESTAVDSESKRQVMIARVAEAGLSLRFTDDEPASPVARLRWQAR